MPDDGATIVFIGPSDAEGQWAAMRGGARQAARKYPMVQLETIAAQPGELARAAEQALSFGPAAVCIYVPPGDDIDIAIRKIVESGAYTITAGRGSRHELAFGHVRVDWTGAAEVLGRQIEKIADHKVSCLLLHWASRSEADADCLARFSQRARHRGVVTIIDKRDAGAETSLELVRQMFKLFPNAGLIVTLDPLPWLSARPADLLGANAAFATIGAPPELWAALRDGQATALCGPLDAEIGRYAVELALGSLTQSADPGQVRAVDCELVTPDQLDSFANRYAEAAGMQVDQLLKPAAATAPISDERSDKP